VQGPQHNDPSRDARQLPSGVILFRGTRGLRSVPSHATKPHRDIKPENILLSGKHAIVAETLKYFVTAP
jgi:serine/threonine protein kinase